MAIEFRCSVCGKLLRTGDGTAGRQAQCPQCGTIGQVPGMAAAPEGVVPPAAPPGGESPAAGAGPLGNPPPQPGSPFGGGAAPAGGPEASYQPPSPFGYQMPPGQVYPDAAQRVSAPATALMVIGWLATICSVLLVIGIVVAIAVIASNPQMQGGPPMQGDDQVGVIVACSVYLVMGLVGTVLGVLILIGARRMKRLESYGFAMTAAIIALIPCVSPCGLLSLPFGIWALVVLLDNYVKASFRS